MKGSVGARLKMSCRLVEFHTGTEKYLDKLTNIDFGSLRLGIFADK